MYFRRCYSEISNYDRHYSTTRSALTALTFCHLTEVSKIFFGFAHFTDLRMQT